MEGKILPLPKPIPTNVKVKLIPNNLPRNPSKNGGDRNFPGPSGTLNGGN